MQEVTESRVLVPPFTPSERHRVTSTINLREISVRGAPV